LIFKKENSDISFWHNSGKVSICLGCWSLKGGERTYVGRITTGKAFPYVGADSELGMTGGK
jgi:hypothetical protein